MKIPDLLAQAKRPVFSFEFFLPKSADKLNEFLKNTADFKTLSPDFVSLTYGAGGSDRHLTIETAGRIQNEIGLETACHLSCISHRRSEIIDILGRIAGLGIRNIVALRGDVPRDGTALPEKERDFAHAADLVSCIKRRGGFDIAVAGYPETHPEALSPNDDLRRLVEKVNAGAEWVITQLFFDCRHYFDFVRHAQAAGVAVPIIPGVMPIQNLIQVERFSSLCGVEIPEILRKNLSDRSSDPEAIVRYGMEYAVAQCRELLAGGAPGIHFYTLNRGRAVRGILNRLREFN
ncbi:MAG: methylenetetrahydrofolate reductase [NAD(P)H] [Elusimicrobiota bacterium]